MNNYTLDISAYFNIFQIFLFHSLFLHYHGSISNFYICRLFKYVILAPQNTFAQKGIHPLNMSRKIMYKKDNYLELYNLIKSRFLTFRVKTKVETKIYKSFIITNFDVASSRFFKKDLNTNVCPLNFFMREFCS